MKYDEKYPDGESAGMEPKDQDMVRVSEARECWHCREMTRWASLSFEAFLCSEECSDAKWNEYFDAWAVGLQEFLKKRREKHEQSREQG